MSAHRPVTPEPTAQTPWPRGTRGPAPSDAVNTGPDGVGPDHPPPVARAPRIPRHRPSILAFFLRNPFAGVRP
jgi:hypothetical protein